MLLELKVSPIPNGMMLTMIGGLTFDHREEFLKAVDTILLKGCRHLILQMAGVQFVDRQGLGLLVLVAQNFKAMQGRVSILNPQRYVGAIMALANIQKLIPVYV